MSSLMQDVASYERWLGKHCKVVKEDLEFKHERMRESAFVFLRATYFRWAKIIEEECPDLADAPQVLCIGDTHVENFGTWRDADGRHVWGVNDFDEAAVMPYPFDLVRLLVSARLSPHWAAMICYSCSAAQADTQTLTLTLAKAGGMMQLAVFDHWRIRQPGLAFRRRRGGENTCALSGLHKLKSTWSN